jgi:hypothetical protein
MSTPPPLPSPARPGPLHAHTDLSTSQQRGAALSALRECRIKQWPPRVDAHGVTVFLIRVRARPQLSASRRPKTPVVSVTKADLLGSEEADSDIC